MKILLQLSAALALTALLAAPAQADIVINTTRVIYPEQDREITVKLTNDEETQPRLVQAWIDDGASDKTPDELDVPFQLTPPVTRMEAGKSQSLRIIHTKDKALPTDRESVFWLNVLGVPPKPDDAAEQSSLRFAFRTRIKLFFRPQNLPGKVADAPAALQWKLLPGSGKETVLEVRNPSAYHVSFANVAVALDGRAEEEELQASMVAPGGSERFVLKSAQPAPGAKAEVRFKIVNDFGEAETHTAPL